MAASVSSPTVSSPTGNVASSITSQHGSVRSYGEFCNDATPPASSSTVLPSSVVHTPPTVLRESTSPPCSQEEDSIKCAQDQPAQDQGPVNTTQGQSSSGAAHAPPPAMGSVSLPPSALKSNTITSYSWSGESTSSSSSWSGRDICLGDKGHPYALTTDDAQIQFSCELSRLLLEVIRRRDHSQHSHDSERSKSCSEDSENSSRPSLSTSSSIYAADISLSHSAAHSAMSSFSGSASNSIASSLAPSFPAGDNSASPTCYSVCSSEGLEFADTPMAAHFVYGSISDEAEDEEMDLVEAENDNDVPQSHPASEDIVEDLIRPSTPSPTENLSTPAAPKKIQYHFYLPNANMSSSRKRPRAMTTSDSPGQDELPPGECMRAKSSSSSSSVSQNAQVRGVSSPPLEDRIMEQNDNHKRARPSPDLPQPVSVHSQARLLAKEPASFRRAASLRSDPSTKFLSIAEVKKKPAVATVVYPKTSPAAAPDDGPDSTDYPPTQPASPVVQSSSLHLSTPSSPLPIISPAAFGPIPHPPLTSEDVAEARLITLIKKEYAAKVSDGLLPAGEDEDRMSVELPPPVDSEQEMWIALGEAVSIGGTEDRKNRLVGSKDRPPTHERRENVALSLGIEEDFRVRVVEWILDVTPPTFASNPTKCANLRAQLTESPNTRWHAAHLFTRYFLRIGVSPLSSPIPEPSSDEQGSRILQGREALTWDIAVACISLSVKFHRDFLHPLYPALARDYLILAPHTMEYDDLESAHRDILSAMDYCVGSYTPGAYLEEILAALPSIRPFIDTRGDWEVACAETWEIIFDSLVDISYLHYPIYMITGCALVLGAVESIVYRKKTESALKSKYTSEAAGKRRRGMKCECEKLRVRAFKAVSCVEQDVQDLFGITKASWMRCMDWLKAMEA